MTRALILGAALAISARTGVAVAAADFSGTWKIDLTRGTSAGGGNGGGRGTGGGLGLGQSAGELTIRQDAKSLTLDERRADQTARLIYALDGRRVKNKLSAGKNAGVSADYESQWKGDRLVTTIVIPATADAAAIRYEEVRYLDKDGALIVETAIPGQQNARKVVYLKQR